MKIIARFLVSGLILFLFLWAAPSRAEANNSLAQIARANDLYIKKQYREAADIYEKLAAQGFDNGYLYYNLGNAYFRLGDIGQAVLNYSRAKKLVPRFGDVEANLRYAIRETPDKLMETSSPFLKNVIFWVDDFNQLEYVQAILIANFLFWLAMIGGLVFRTGAMDAARKVLLFILLITVISGGAKFYADSQYQTGVVLEKQIDVKSAQGTDNVTLFQLHEGAIINIRDEEGEWYKIELNDGKKGWAPKKSISPA